MCLIIGTYNIIQIYWNKSLLLTCEKHRAMWLQGHIETEHMEPYHHIKYTRTVSTGNALSVGVKKRQIKQSFSSGRLLHLAHVWMTYTGVNYGEQNNLNFLLVCKELLEKNYLMFKFYTFYRTHKQHYIISKCSDILFFIYLEQFHICKLTQYVW